MFNARSILDGVSLSNKNSIGEKLSTEALNIYDDGLHEKNISSSPFDGEGTPTKRLCLINKGRIENFIHSESTARIFKTIPTGHAGLGSKVSVSPDWIVVEKSEENSDLKTTLDHSTYEGEFVYIEELNIPVELVHLTGSVELGPITGMAEAIVDLVATGKTLKENGLIKIDDLFYSTARLIGNPLSMRLDNNHLRDTILSIESNNGL